MKAHGTAKKTLEHDVMELKQSIASWTHHGHSVNGFDWAVEFAEVFREGGFDVLVANPPYVRMELFKDLKPILRQNFSNVHSERADLYCYFYARAVELLRDCGMLVFISSNKWLRSGYGDNLRGHLAAECSILNIIDFGDLPVFKSATAYPMIFSARRGKTLRTNAVFTKVESLDAPYPEVKLLVESRGRVLSDEVSGKTWALSDSKSGALASKMLASGIPLAEYCGNAIYRGIVTGLNEAFIIDASTKREIVRDCPQAKDIVKPMVFGRDVKRWRIEGRDQWLLYMYHGIKTKGIESATAHLRPFREQLEKRATEQPWYELQQPQMRYQTDFEKVKIVVPDIAKGLRFALDRSGAYLSNTAYFIPHNDLYLLGVLNSLPIELFYAELSTQVRGGYMRFFRQYMEKLPIPAANAAEKSRVVALVQRLLDADGEDCVVVENRLNESVAALYGLDIADLMKIQGPQGVQKTAKGKK
jgi:hypothetical protein